ncbi:hypothetical protein DPMN_145022 [Dreissena polymorpha]|uniref:Secreted protein n=1 Tax=Dreissena polymorpha TaxID=45954 RepID=A0A9D4F575_DREPO|nr:hypothetical protein DPMN_145022 [Dreissena polymorpha]
MSHPPPEVSLIFLVLTIRAMLSSSGSSSSLLGITRPSHLTVEGGKGIRPERRQMFSESPSWETVICTSIDHFTQPVV